MVVVMKPGTKREDIDSLVAKFKEMDLDVGVTNGVGCTILGLVGDTTAVDMDKISINPHVERVMRVQEPYKKANRKFHPEDTVVRVGNAEIGGGSFSVIAGPCSVESEAQIIEVAEDVKRSGAALLRGGAFKPRTSPYWTCCWRPRRLQDCPSSLRSWLPGMWTPLRRRWIWFRSGRGICRISTCSKRWGV